MSFDNLFKVRLIEQFKVRLSRSWFVDDYSHDPSVKPIHRALSDLLNGFITELVNDPLNGTVKFVKRFDERFNE